MTHTSRETDYACMFVDSVSILLIKNSNDLLAFLQKKETPEISSQVEEKNIASSVTLKKVKL